MEENTVIAFRRPANFQEDPLTEVLQAGAHKLLAEVDPNRWTAWRRLLGGIP